MLPCTDEITKPYYSHPLCDAILPVVYLNRHLAMFLGAFAVVQLP